MAVGFPTKANWAAGDVLTASAQDDLAGTVNLLSNASATSGSQLVSNVAGSSLAYVATPSSSNPFLNSGMNVWQRGTSVSVAASTTSAYTADRWCVQTGANTASTISRQATSDTTNLPFIQYCGRFQRNSGQTGAGMTVTQSVETINAVPFAGKQVTFSFYARAGANYSATSNALSRGVIGGTGSDQNFFSGYTGQTNYGFGTITLTTTWQRFTVTDTIGATITEFTPYFSYAATGTAGTNDYFEITGVQIDIGSVALPFRTYAATYQGELAACQRYYWRGTTTTSNFYGQGTVYSSTTASAILCPFPTQMRIVPSSVDYSNLVLTDPTTSYAVSAVSLDASASTPRIGFLYCTNATVTAYRPVLLGISSSSAGYLGFNAEL
jgi:hypothetical protein